ncbi:hypothetical protein Prum_063460 [Phytohabitans rumicis]|uniref:Uncharacterized protein n=1 Tax=Phytohabitans rumicis TaxID=1076125 RepID=A0A6V8L8U3_9ACTN|nr:hypothetical protein Prum_063460 [Phytohabitans rumicis]
MGLPRRYLARGRRRGRIPRAATVTYRPNSARGTGVDTLTAVYMLPRADVDPLLDPVPQR